MQLWRRIVYIGIGFFESLTVTGILFGWPALLHMFQIEGIYSHFCIEDGFQVQNVTAQSATTIPTIIVKLRIIIIK